MSRARETAADLGTIAGYALREAVRRRALVVVVVLTLGFLALYAYGANEAFDEVSHFAHGGGIEIDDQVLTGSTLLGLSMFVTLFLGTVLAVFVTLNAVRGDAERGCCNRSSCGPSGARRSCWRASSQRRRSAWPTCWSSTPRRSRSPAPPAATGRTVRSPAASRWPPPW